MIRNDSGTLIISGFFCVSTEIYNIEKDFSKLIVTYLIFDYNERA